MRVTLALFAFAFALAFAAGEALGQSSLPDDTRQDVERNLETGSLGQAPAILDTRVLSISPKAATRPSETHSALVLSNASFSGDITFRGRVQTVKQLRIGSAPNPWECVWIVWNHKDDHFYYVALKTNGWEIGKRDRAFRGQQRFLKTGVGSYALGQWHDFEITQTQNEITVRVDGDELASFTDTMRPYTSGKIGFYTEDAEIQIGGVSAPFNDNFEDYPLEFHRGDEHVVKNWFIPFLGHGYSAIAVAKK